MKQPSSVLDAALLYAQRGWRVMPLRGKIPLLKDWTKVATTDVDTIHEWFHGDYADCNVGIATGEQSGIFVLDVDGEGGEQSYLDLEATWGKLPQTYEVKTGRGRQLYFLQPFGVHTKTQASGELGLKLDIRGDGGQVVAPPSVHPETHTKYLVINDCVPATAPKWLIDLITKDSQRTASANTGEIPERIGKNARNATLTSIAGRMRRIGLTSDEMFHALREINTQRCVPALKENEIATICKSVGRYPPGRVFADGSLNDAEFCVTDASEGKDMPITWRWPLYLPKGMLVGWGGDPGQGKSTMAYTLAAYVSAGRKLPGDDGLEDYEPQNVIVLSAEDDRDKTIKPRLRIAGADMSRIKIVSALTKTTQPISFPRHLTQLAELIRETKAGLVMIDPLDSFLGEDVDSHKNADVRRAVMPLVQIAESTNCTMLVLGHLNKAAQSSAIYRFGGSIAFIAAARAAFSFADSETSTEDDARHVMACVKTNVGKKPKSLLYRIADQHVEGVGSVAKIEFLGESSETAASTLAPAVNGNGKDKRSAQTRRDVEEFLRRELADGPRLSKDIMREFKRASICSERTFDTMRNDFSTTKKCGQRWFVGLKGCDFSDCYARQPGEDDE